MVISGPLTPAQVSFLLGIIPVCVAWLYSEFLEYKKTAASLKTGRDSDINLVELGNDTVKEDDRAVLLEGGGLQSASPRSHGSFIASPVVRLFTMEESFLLENRLTLRAMS
ncbi:hypothetical protein Ccrd_021998 [Cynara cardunculus var. scolymus]|uniref:Uncharacterized protein n=1 Tax=Cynara cardunculus var. scolymus TaxID=59895 RepID=A0A103XZJ2_CYNCS|nr:hypothetical protein Ccrd_021998 [Cynara cardunculus var. scolymus]